MSKKRVTVAFFDFASCEGCQIELTNLGDTVFMGLLDHVEFVEFREAMSEKASGPIDIAFIEGSFTREADRKRLEEIRARASTVIAYGACATIGGINALKNHQQDYRKFVYGEDAEMPHLDSDKARPIHEVIKVDYKIHGCPIDRAEFAKIVSDLLHGKEPLIPNYPVCVECKMRETVCRYQSGDHCMGPTARAGCGAPCPADGIPCEACRGFVDRPNQEALEKVLVVRGGLPVQRAATKSRMWTANYRNQE
jgi:sulfhydrogenase subunit delta